MVLPVPHSRVSEALNERNKRFKLLNLTLDFLSHGKTARDAMEMFHTLVHGFEGIVDIGSK